MTPRSTDSESTESTSDSDQTLEAKSTSSLRISRSFDNLLHSSTFPRSSKDKVSVENLSEDSGYSEHLCNIKSNSNPNLKNNCFKQAKSLFQSSQFVACDLDFGCIQNFAAYSFGSSCQDLSVLDVDFSNRKWSNNCEYSGRPSDLEMGTTECAATTTTSTSKFSGVSVSEPNLPMLEAVVGDSTTGRAALSSQSVDQFGGIGTVCSVPSDLNLVGDSGPSSQTLNSIAEKNYDIGDLSIRNNMAAENRVTAFARFKKPASAPFRREGSYAEAMTNQVDMNDDENRSHRYKKSTIVAFDQKVLKAISETSLRSLSNSGEKLDLFKTSTPISQPLIGQNRNVISTPNLFDYNDTSSGGDLSRCCSQKLPIRKSSLVNRSSTSTSGLSEDEKTLTSSKSFSGSTGSKGVHFCPVVSEVKWRDVSRESTTEDNDSSSLSSTPEPHLIIKPEPRHQLPRNLKDYGDLRMTCSQPELQGTILQFGIVFPAS